MINTKLKIGIVVLIMGIITISGWLIWNNQLSENQSSTKIFDQEALKQEALKIDISKPQQVSPNTFKVAIEINVADYTVSKVDGFDVIKIEGADEIHANGEPIIPKIKYVQMPLPKGSSNIKLSMTQNTSSSIGCYNIPCARVLHYGEEDSALITCVNLTELYPTPPYWFYVSDFDDYKEVAVGSALIQYNPQTKETIFYTYIELELTYEAPITAVITDFLLDKTKYENGETIKAFVTVENIGSDILTELHANLKLENLYGEVEVFSQGILFDVVSGETRKTYISLSQNLPAGSYFIELEITNNKGDILGTSSEYISIVEG